MNTRPLTITAPTSEISAGTAELLDGSQSKVRATEAKMTRKLLKIIDGPDKPALQFALAYPERESVHFILEGDAVDASILRIEEMAEGFTFEINGRLTSGLHEGEPFQGIYSVETRSGSIALHR